MRHLVRCILALTPLLIVAVPAAAEHKKSCGIDGNSPGEYICQGTSAGHDVRHDVVPVQSGPPTTAYPFRELWRPVLSQDPDGNPCLTTETVRLGRDPTMAEDIESERQFLRLLRTYSVCPDVPALPTTTPAMEAAEFLRQIDLPVPTPYVQPDALPVGFEAFLETGAPTNRTYGPVDTPFGPLVLTATAQVYVDWDDPHDDVAGEHGPYTGQPGPHPNGDITHVYQHHGMYDIAVRYVWTASWAIGDVSGTIEGVETSGSYPAPGFEAYSREAVGR
tara:strand:- start:38 stop:868 length:831 start_codon:yes stop_codon:yes gene_type:complete